jgi:catechol 2,3-dioxygenase-like lactoylglutathione lyase family enzyme
MFSHVMVGTRDLEKAKAFYNKVLGTLGFEGEPIHNVGPSGHSRLFYRHNGGTFCVTEPINGEPASAANGGTIGFQCDSAEQVKQFHDVAVASGGATCEDPPGLRNGSVGAVHLAYVRDPDGNKLCALHRPVK